MKESNNSDLKKFIKFNKENEKKLELLYKGDKMEIALEQRRAYSEVLEVLRHMEKKYVDKIPNNVIMFFYDNCQLDYEFRMTQSIDKEKLKPATIELLALLDSTYWHTYKKKEDLIFAYNNASYISKDLNGQLEKKNEFTKIDVNSDLPAENKSTVQKIFGIIKKIFIKLFADY